MRFFGQRAALPILLLVTVTAHAQQFNSDNQWTAPHGVGTFIATAGEGYSSMLAVAALKADWEFNLGVTHYPEISQLETESHNTGLFYAKRRIRENAEQNGGMAYTAGTGIDPGHLDSGEVTDTFKSWFGTFIYTIPYRDGRITWDLVPGVLVNRDTTYRDKKTWGITYSSRAAFYGVIPHSAIVTEIFGTAGEAKSDAQYRIGVRWERPNVITSATFNSAFNGSDAAGFEIGVMYLTRPRFCFGGCR